YTSLTACHSILIFSLRIPPPPKSTLFPYTTLFRSRIIEAHSFRQRHLQVTLKRSGGRFEHRVKVLGSQPLLSLDVQSNRTALSQSQDLFVQRPIAQRRRHVLQRQLLVGHRRERPDRDERGAPLGGGT